MPRVMTAKRDWLGECNDQHIPLNDFQNAFCERCLQVECTRSQYGKSRFEARVVDWEDRLFLSVPRMDAQDPRFAELSAKRFTGLNTMAIPKIREWVDPRDLKEPPEAPLAPDGRVYESFAATKLKAQVIVDPDEQGTTGTEPPHTAPDAPLPLVEAVKLQAPPRLAMTNTPSQSKRMVGKPVATTPTAKIDPWESKKTVTDGLKVVPKGAKIRLDDSGV